MRVGLRNVKKNIKLHLFSIYEEFKSVNRLNCKHHCAEISVSWLKLAAKSSRWMAPQGPSVLTLAAKLKPAKMAQ